MIVTSKNKSGMLRSLIRIVLIVLIIKEKPLLMTSPFDSKYIDWLLFPFEEHGSQRFHFNIFRQTFTCVLIDENGSLDFFRMIFNSRGEIYRITNTCISGTMLRASVAGNDSAGCNSDADINLGFIECRSFLVKSFQ